MVEVLIEELRVGLALNSLIVVHVGLTSFAGLAMSLKGTGMPDILRTGWEVEWECRMERKKCCREINKGT